MKTQTGKLKTFVSNLLWVDLAGEDNARSLIDHLIDVCGTDASNCSVLMETETLDGVLEEKGVQDKHVEKIMRQLSRKAKLSNCDVILAYA